MVGMREAKQEYFDKENTGVWDVPKFVENVKNNKKYAEQVYDYYISWKTLLAECQDVADSKEYETLFGNPDVYKISEDIYILSDIIAGREYFVPRVIGREKCKPVCETFDEALLYALAIKHVNDVFSVGIRATDAAEILGMVGD